MDPISYEWTAEAAAIRDGARPLLTALMADVTGTLGWRRQIAEQIVNDWVAHGIGVAETPQEFALSVGEGIQQYFHDTFVDTTWPSCPDHPNHPLWLHAAADGSLQWRCEKGTLSLPLGSLTPRDPAAPDLPELTELPADADDPGW